MRVILAALFVALLTVPGSAQFKPISEPTKSKTDSQAPKKKEDDSGYKSAIDRLPDQKFDPWRNLR